MATSRPYGVVPYRGHLLPGIVQPGDISVAGPLARSARDLAAMLKLLAGTDGTEARGYKLALPPAQQKSLKDFRVAVMVTDEQSEVDLPVQDMIGKLTTFLGKRVKKLSTTARPAFTTKEAMDVYIALLRSATSRRQTDEDFAHQCRQGGGIRSADDSYLTKMLRAYVLPHRDWLRYNERRHQMRLLWDQFFDDWDVMLCPAAASAAFPHDQQGERHERTIPVNGKHVPTTDQLFWAGYSGGFLSAVDRRTHGAHGARTAGGHPDHRPAVWRLHLDPLRRTAGKGIRRLRAAAGLLSRTQAQLLRRSRFRAPRRADRE